MSGQMIIVVWGYRLPKPGFGSEGTKIATMVNFDPLNAEPCLRMIQEHGVEGQDGQIWKYKTARVDLSSSTPRLDIFMEED